MLKDARRPRVSRTSHVGKRRRDHDAEAEIEEGPCRVFTRRSATEVDPGQQDRGAGVLWLVQDKRRVETPVVKQEGAEAGTFDPLEKLLGNDLVRVHVVTAHWRHATTVGREG